MSARLPEHSGSDSDHMTINASQPTATHLSRMGAVNNIERAIKSTPPMTNHSSRMIGVQSSQRIMPHRRTILLAIIGLLLSAAPAFAAFKCGPWVPRETAIADLRQNGFGVAGTGIIGNATPSTLEIWINPETDGWVAISNVRDNPGGWTSCFVTGGKAWTEMMPPEGDPA